MGVGNSRSAVGGTQGGAGGNPPAGAHAGMQGGRVPPGGHFPPQPVPFGYTQPGQFLNYTPQAIQRQNYPPPLVQRPPGPQAPRMEQAAEKQKTKTIRNDVNLKKASLKLVADEHDPDIYYPHFSFDCGAPCAVSVYFGGSEDAGNRLALSQGMQAPGPRVYYDKKLGCKFPPPGMDKAELRAYGLVSSLYTTDGLAASTSQGQGETWPLLIRLECVLQDADAGDDEDGPGGRNLKDLAPGDPLPGWVQSQTTYAVLQKTASGFSCKVERQKIFVHGAIYELQEIYGLENMAHRDDSGDDDMARECVVCMSAPRDTTLLPCRHMCLCHDCAKALRTQTNKCPICRRQVQSLLEITVKS